MTVGAATNAPSVVPASAAQATFAGMPAKTGAVLSRFSAARLASDVPDAESRDFEMDFGGGGSGAPYGVNFFIPTGTVATATTGALDDTCNQGACVNGECQKLPASEGTSCDDGVFCNGADTCDAAGLCQHAGDPCPGGQCATCEEIGAKCFDPCHPWHVHIEQSEVNRELRRRGWRVIRIW